jgi:hypothetical protein
MDDFANLDLAIALPALREHTEAMPLAPGHLLADVVLYSLCIDVLEHAEVVAKVASESFARAGSVNARAALESAVDANYLTASRAEYDLRAAQARVMELYEIEEIEKRSPPVPGVDSTDRLSAEEIIIADARSFDEQVAGSGKPLRGAWERFTKTSGAHRLHWSGLTKEDLFNQVFQAAGDDEPVGAMAGSLHAILSTSSHPHPRVGARELRWEPDGMLAIFTRHEEPMFGRSIAALSCMMASSALARRVLFDPPAA